MYNMTDLKACYDRELLKIRSIVQESVRVEQLLIKLLIKILLIIEHYIYTRFRASSKYYRGKKEKQVGIGLGHTALVNIYYNSSYVAIKDIENEKLDIIVKVLISKQKEQ